MANNKDDMGKVNIHVLLKESDVIETKRAMQKTGIFSRSAYVRFALNCTNRYVQSERFDPDEVERVLGKHQS